MTSKLPPNSTSEPTTKTPLSLSDQSLRLLAAIISAYEQKMPCKLHPLIRQGKELLAKFPVVEVHDG